MIIDRIARTVMANFEESEIVLAIVDRDGCYVSSKIDVFEEIFADPRMLDDICGQIDDGCEPAFMVSGEYLVAGSSINNIGYSILLIPHYSAEKAALCQDFGEIVLNQIAALAEQTHPESETSRFAYNCEMMTEAALN